MPQIAGLRGTLAKGARDTSRAVYRYHQVFSGGSRTFTRKMVIAAVKLAPYSEGVIRPHIAASATERDEELAKIRAAKGQDATVFAGFRDAPNEVDRQFRGTENGPPTYETTTPDGTKHRIWRVSSAEVIGKLRPLFAPKKLHILDGHARYEAMLAYSAELDAKQPLSMYSSGKYGLFTLVNIEDPALIVAPHHRVVRNLTAKPADVLASAKKSFLIEKVSRDPAKLSAALADAIGHQPTFAIAFHGEPDAYKLTLSGDVSILNEGVVVNRALQKLEPIVLESYFVPRFMPGAKLTGALDLAAALASDAEAVIAMRPVPLVEILHADELGQLMPDDATAFVPELANPVTFSVDPDEDLV
jgi:uncharacterized protein (DUF1015 family)